MIVILLFLPKGIVPAFTLILQRLSKGLKANQSKQPTEIISTKTLVGTKP
jgi:hypothetical protein